MTADPRDLLRRVGEALYGPRWQTPLAADLGVAERTVRFWLSARQRPRPGVWADLARLMAGRQRRLDALAAEVAALAADLAAPVQPAA